MARSRGVAYIAYGAPAHREAWLSIQSLHELHALPVTLVGDMKSPYQKDFEGANLFTKASQKARWAKTSLDQWSPYDHTLFLDADTRVHEDLSVGFRALSAGWELVIVPSKPSVPGRTLWHLTTNEVVHTLNTLNYPSPIMFNSGVFFFRKTPRVKRMFAAWREEWLEFKDKDQGALLRALHRAPVSILLLGSAFNGGEVVEHLYGRAA